MLRAAVVVAPVEVLAGTSVRAEQAEESPLAQATRMHREVVALLDMQVDLGRPEAVLVATRDRMQAWRLIVDRLHIEAVWRAEEQAEPKQPPLVRTVVEPGSEKARILGLVHRYARNGWTRDANAELRYLRDQLDAREQAAVAMWRAGLARRLTERAAA
jgi:hypothetical protein